MKKTIKTIFGLLILISLSSCGGSSIEPSSSSSSASSSLEPSFISSSSSASGLTTKDDYMNALNRVHSFPAYSATIKITKGTEQISYSYNKKWIDVTNKIERLLFTSKTLETIEGGNASTVEKTTDIYKSETQTYTKGDDGLYKVSEGSDAVFALYKVDFNFSKMLNVEFAVEDFKGVLSGDVTDLTGFDKSNSFSQATDMKVKAMVDSEGNLTDLNINYTYKEIYTVASSFVYNYLETNLVLPTV